MIQIERRQQILIYLEKSHTASIKELADAIYTSEASIRRDLAVLETQGFVHRVYGGVMLSNYKNSVVPLHLRDSDNSTAKEKIAQKAASLLFDGATVMLDASSTTRRIIRYLDSYRDLKIITNNVRILNELSSNNVRIWSTGGLYNHQNHAFVGPAAEKYIKSMSADILFFSSQGISEDGEISDASEEETSLRKAMLERAERKVFLCDSSKIGIRRVFTLCTKDDVNDIICDIPLPWEKQ